MTRRNINFDQLWIIGFTAISSQHHLPRRASLNTFSQSVDHSRRIQVNKVEKLESVKAALSVFMSVCLGQSHDLLACAFARKITTYFGLFA